LKTYGITHNATAKGTASMSKTVGKTLTATAKGEASMSWARTRELVREYRERHPGWFAANVVLVGGSPFVGLWIAGWWGVAVGLALGLLGTWVSGKAYIRVREKTREITQGKAE